MTDEYLSSVRCRFADDLYATEATAITIEEAGEGFAECRMKIQRVHQNAMGGVMGGAIFTLCDFAFAVASNGIDRPLTTTLSTSVSFSSQPKGATLIARAKCLKDGGSTCLYEVTVKDERETLVAVATFNGYKLRAH